MKMKRTNMSASETPRPMWMSFSLSFESRTAMAELMSNEQHLLSIPERELLRFVSGANELLDAWEPRLLKEIWLDEAASMDVMPGPKSWEWRFVTVAAWAKLARRLMDPPGITD